MDNRKNHVFAFEMLVVQRNNNFLIRYSMFCNASRLYLRFAQQLGLHLFLKGQYILIWKPYIDLGAWGPSDLDRPSSLFNSRWMTVCNPVQFYWCTHTALIKVVKCLQNDVAGTWNSKCLTKIAIQPITTKWHMENFFGIILLAIDFCCPFKIWQL